MKTFIKACLIALTVLVALSATLLFAVAANSGDINGDGRINASDVIAVIKRITGLEEGSGDINGDGKTDLLDAIAILKDIVAAYPKLTALSLDEGSIAFDPNTHRYSFTLPAGRPRVPRVEAAAASGTEVTITQATFADDKTEAMAKVEVSNEDGTSVYEILFTKDKAKGFELQFDDRYPWTPAYTLKSGESFTFTSSNSSAASVDAGGVITAKALSTSPITIQAKVGGTVKDTLTIQKINKAQIAVFLIVGQSNAAGSSDEGVDRAEEITLSDAPTAGKAYCQEVAADGKFNRYFDLSEGRNGFSPALSKRWYDLTGEKVLCLQTAKSGSPIQNWEKGGDRYYGNSVYRNLYDVTLEAYTKFKTDYAEADSNFEIVRTHYYWCQGETGMSHTWYGDPYYNWGHLNSPTLPDDYIMTAEDYYTKFTAIHNNFVNEMDVDIGAIMLVRATSMVSSAESQRLQRLTDLVPARAAQYALNNGSDSSLVIASRLCDIARMESSSDTSLGWGYMGPQNLHYLQRGYNAQGIELANNTFAMVNAYEDRGAETLEVIDTNGRTRLADGAEFSIEAGKTKQITAIVLPLYAEAKAVTYRVTQGADFCSVDRYGMISIKADTPENSRAVIAIENGSGLKQTLTVKTSKAHIISDIEYRWDFNDLNEKNGLNNLSKGVNSSNSYTISNGLYKSSSNTTDFALAKPIHLDQSNDWAIEWRGKLSANSALLGTEGSTSNFLYLAYGVNFNSSGATSGSAYHPFRMVTGTGTGLMISYAGYESYCTAMNTWKAEFDSASKKLTLYLKNSTGWTAVGSASTPSTFAFDFTHMLGRYSVSGTNVDYRGELDYVQINFVG